MTKLIRLASEILLLVGSTITYAQSADRGIDINDREVPEPIKCYALLGEIAGDKGMTVGLAVQLCAGTKDAKATLLCYKVAFNALELNRGLAVELCSEGRKLK